ncbi:hypothetical protein GCM10011491_41250 [Brucella endophytica]|uniref:Uncharacterized protein n=1 Tax=Brucella endophytica TaxID=1963359 RepID=A0A916SNC8_9HYPH|nr:hypothetical protein [Brucella endophytica]GGB09052.1 hypothetical protein GCM10011491_41250 [Brucella endophytica]
MDYFGSTDFVFGLSVGATFGFVVTLLTNYARHRSQTDTITRALLLLANERLPSLDTAPVFTNEPIEPRVRLVVSNETRGDL